MQIIREMYRQEGAGSFFKGLTPKILVVGPKLVFSYTMAMTLIPYFGKYGEYFMLAFGYECKDWPCLRISFLTLSISTQ